MQRFRLLAISLLLSACSTPNYIAPVTNGWQNTQAASQVYQVQPNDTLDSIAFRYELNDQNLARLNHLHPPYYLVVGQTLLLKPNAQASVTPTLIHNEDTSDNTPPPAVVTGGAPLVTITSTASVTSITAPTAQPTTSSVITGQTGQWQWPAQGKIIQSFSTAYGGNKGIDIAGKAGEKVYAASNGQVVYCGTGLRGYGLLIIIKKNAHFVSAYAHNSKALVKEGQPVKAGQAIAVIGDTDAPRIMLHFEIRQDGKPMNPLSYLPTR